MNLTAILNCGLIIVINCVQWKILSVSLQKQTTHWNHYIATVLGIPGILYFEHEDWREFLRLVKIQPKIQPFISHQVCREIALVLQFIGTWKFWSFVIGIFSTDWDDYISAIVTLCILVYRISYFQMVDSILRLLFVCLFPVMFNFLRRHASILSSIF